MLIKHKKKTGVNPVRARRRKIQQLYLSYPLPQIGDKPLDFSEKADK